MEVIHAVVRGSVAFIARCLETGDEAVVITEPRHKDWNGRGPDSVIDTRGALIDLSKSSRKNRR